LWFYYQMSATCTMHCTGWNRLIDPTQRFQSKYVQQLALDCSLDCHRTPAICAKSNLTLFVAVFGVRCKAPRQSQVDIDLSASHKSYFCATVEMHCRKAAVLVRPSRSESP